MWRCVDIDENRIFSTGTEGHIYSVNIINVTENYDTSYAEYITDNVFLMDVKQVNTVYNNSFILGDDYYIGQPTSKYVETSEYKDSDLDENKSWKYWLSTPCCMCNCYTISPIIYVELRRLITNKMSAKV